MDKNEIFEKCVRIYILLYAHFVASLKNAKRYKHAAKFAAINVKTLNDIFKVDEVMRSTFVYSKRHPNSTAPHGFYPLLGMVLAIRHMQWDITGQTSRFGTFLGHFAEFCHSEHDFGKELQELYMWDARDVASGVFHEAS